MSAAALALPLVVEDGRAWKVVGTSLAWERPLRPRDVSELGAGAPAGVPLGLRTAGLEGKEGLLAEHPSVFFTTSHFEGYPAVLARLPALRVGLLRDVLEEAWLDRAPRREVKAWLAAHPRG